MKILKPYERLAELYDKDWGDFSLKYVDIIHRLGLKITITPKTAIDIACGTGNLISVLSENFSVVGSDISESMIEIARAKYPKLTFIVSDMAEIKPRGKFGLVLCPFDSINYTLSLDALRRAFQNVFTLLSDDGVFLFDFNTERLMKDKHRGIVKREVYDVKFTQTCIYHPIKKIAETVFDFGNSEREIHLQKPYSFSDIKTLLEKIGFELLYASDMFEDTEVKEGSYKIMIQCRKFMSFPR